MRVHLPVCPSKIQLGRVAAGNGQIEVLMDGGVRHGNDIVKAVYMEARAVLVGRAYAYGLAAAVYPGVVRALQILKSDFERTMRLLGCGSVGDLGKSYIQSVPTNSPGLSR
jgi:isopentenyl diphosphate isomerase/L-lactate dehydrogenase-like FMN-dependent dehydrogenase